MALNESGTLLRIDADTNGAKLYTIALHEAQNATDKFGNSVGKTIGLQNEKLSNSFDKLGNKTTKWSGDFVTDSGKVVSASSQVDKNGFRPLSTTLSNGTGMAAQYIKALQRVIVVVPMWMAARAAIQAVSKAISDSIKHFIDLDSGLARARAVARGTSEQISAAMVILRKSAEDFAAVNKGTSKDVTEAFYQMGTAGIDLQTSLAASVPVAKLANATYGETVTVGKAVAGMYNVLGDSITNASSPQEKMAKLTDVLASAWSNHRIELDELQRAISNVGAQAKRFGLSMEETVAIVATSSDFLIESGRAGTLFSRVLGDMSSKLPMVETLLGKTFDKNKPIAWFQVFKDVIAAINKMGAGTPQAEQALEGIFGERARRQAGIFLTEMNKVVATVDEFQTSSKGMVKQLIDIRNNTTEAQLEIYHKNIALIGSNFVVGAIGGTSFAESLKIINEGLKKVAENAIIAGAGTSQFITNLGAVPKLIGFFTGGLVGLEDELLKGNITLEQFNDFVVKMFDETLKGVDTLSNAEVNALVKFKTAIQNSAGEMAKMASVVQRVSKDNKENPIVPTEEDMESSLKYLKAVGASEIQIAQERVKWQLILTKGDEKNVEVIKARNVQRDLELEKIRKNAEAISSMFNSSLSEALKEGDISSFADSLREKIRNAFIDGIAEGLTNKIMSFTNLDIVLGKQLDSLKFERALIDGSEMGSQKYYNAILTASNEAANRLSSALTSTSMAGLSSGKTATIASTAGGLFPGRQQTVPIAPDDYYKTQGIEDAIVKGSEKAQKNSLFNMQNFQKVLGLGLFAYSFFGNIGGKSTASHAYTNTPSGGTVGATTASTTKAYVTNVTIAPVFNLPESVGTDTKNLVKAMSSAITPVLKEMVIKILESENISSGNVN